jgi:hypothetical protein
VRGFWNNHVISFRRSDGKEAPEVPTNKQNGPRRSSPSSQGLLLPHLTERDESLLTFVPQHKPHAPQALGQGKPADAAELRIIAQDARQSVLGDTAAQMMDVVDADIGGEPAQDAWQLIVGAAAKRHRV